MSEKEIDQMLTDAETNNQDDEKERSRISAKIRLEGYVYNIKRKLEKAEAKKRY